MDKRTKKEKGGRPKRGKDNQLDSVGGDPLSFSPFKLNHKAKKEKQMKYVNSFFTTLNNKNIIFLLLLILVTFSFLLSSPECCAVQDGEMKDSANAVKKLVDNNLIPVGLSVGACLSLFHAFMKSSFVPLGVCVASGIGYGFAKTWLSTVYALCM
jgi:hypothetical protein